MCSIWQSFYSVCSIWQCLIVCSIWQCFYSLCSIWQCFYRVCSIWQGFYNMCSIWQRFYMCSIWQCWNSPFLAKPIVINMTTTLPCFYLSVPPNLYTSLSLSLWLYMLVSRSFSLWNFCLEQSHSFRIARESVVRLRNNCSINLRGPDCACGNAHSPLRFLSRHWAAIELSCLLWDTKSKQVDL